MGKSKKAVTSSTNPTSEARQALARAFGVVVRRLRDDRHLTQEQVSWTTKIDRTYISDIERGKSEPTLSKIVRLSQMFEIEPWELVRQAVEELDNPTPRR